MSKQDIKLYYKNQADLGYALKDFIDAYFQDKVEDKELESKIVEVIDANKEKFYKGNSSEIASKPSLILGKTRMDVLQKILNRKVKK